MLQSGLSRELFESWCTDPKNGCIIAGYVVEGTLGKLILSEPKEITTLAGQKLPMKMSVDYVSFSAHTDFQQTKDFVTALKPPHIVRSCIQPLTGGFPFNTYLDIVLTDFGAW